MNVADVAGQIATRLETIDGLRVYGYTPADIQPPAALVGLPTNTTFDITYGRCDRLSIPVVVLVGSVNDRNAQDNMRAYLSGEGDRSIKQALDEGTYTGGIALRVQSATVSWVLVAGVDYLSATFTVDVAG